MSSNSIAQKTFSDNDKLDGTLWRIMTEDVNRDKVYSLANALFNGFSSYTQVGYWQGVAEQSLVIEVITEAVDSVRLLAEQIRDCNSQDAVLVERIANSAWLV